MDRKDYYNRIKKYIAGVICCVFLSFMLHADNEALCNYIRYAGQLESQVVESVMLFVFHESLNPLQRHCEGSWDGVVMGHLQLKEGKECSRWE